MIDTVLIKNDKDISNILKCLENYKWVSGEDVTFENIQEHLLMAGASIYLFILEENPYDNSSGKFLTYLYENQAHHFLDNYPKEYTGYTTKEYIEHCKKLKDEEASINPKLIIQL